MTVEEYCKKLKEKTKVLYEKTPSIHNPYLEQMIDFNSDGFHHFQYNTLGSERNKRAQIDRYRLFPLAPTIIKKAGIVQQHRKTVGAIGRKRHDGFRLTKVIEDWCFISLMPFGNKEIMIKTVLRKIGDGNVNFLSIMPYKAPNYLFDIDE